MSEVIIGTCWHCGRSLGPADYGRETDCSGCAKPTRVCRNCRNYRPGRPNDCLEPMAERCLDKERANFCEWFEPTREPLPGAGGTAAEGLLRAAENLFK